MRKFLLLSACSLAAVSLILSAPPALAQTDPPPQPPPAEGSFFSSVTGYFASFNTNLDSTFGRARGSVFTGVDSIQGGATPLANSLGIEYNLWKSISAESVTRNSGVAGTIVSEQLGIGLNFIVHDVKLTAYADGGFDFTATDSINAKGKKVRGDKLYGEIGLRVFKALTEHTYGGIGIGAQVPANRQIFSIFAGFTY